MTGAIALVVVLVPAVVATRWMMRRLDRRPGLVELVVKQGALTPGRRPWESW